MIQHGSALRNVKVNKEITFQLKGEIAIAQRKPNQYISNQLISE